MRRRIFPALAAALALSAAALPSEGRAMSTVQHVMLFRGRSYVGPGDLGISWSAYYALRAYTRFQALLGVQPLVNLRRASDGHTCDGRVSPATGGLGDTGNCSSIADSGQSVATWGSGTTLYIDELYDLTGNGRPILQATAAKQPSLVFSCVGSKPCWSMPFGASVVLTSASNFTPATGLISLTSVGVRLGGTDYISWIKSNDSFAAGPQIGSNDVANQWYVSAAGAVYFTATDAVWHSATGVISASSTLANLDGVETSSTGGVDTTAGLIGVEGGASTSNTEQAELGFVDNVGLSSANRTALCRNQENYYGASNFGATC